jgi:hypothetical protein
MVYTEFELHQIDFYKLGYTKPTIDLVNDLDEIIAFLENAFAAEDGFKPEVQFIGGKFRVIFDGEKHLEEKGFWDPIQ